MAELKNMFPKGCKVSVKNANSAGKNKLFVANTASVQLLDYFSANTTRCLEVMNPEQLRQHGNLEFSKGSYEAAAQLYTLCLSRSSEPRDVSLSFSNRAECRLRQGMYEKALCDAEAALEIDHEHVKSLFRLGKAFMGVQEHARACVVLSKAVAADNDVGIRTALKEATEFQRQGSTGWYGDVLEGFIMGGKVQACSDFVGPVEVRLTSDGKGRGLFACRDVDAGSLLLVSNALSMVRLDGNSHGELSDVTVKLAKKCMASGDTLRRIYMLAEDDRAAKTEVPPMHLFEPNRSHKGGGEWWRRRSDDEQLQLDLKRIEDVVMTCSYTRGFVECGNQLSALWLLPGFINNSCIPNMSKVEVGKASFFHAARNIKAGEELTLCYIDLHRPWATYRKERSRGNQGCCKRCRVEAAFESRLEDVNTKFQRWFLQDTETAVFELAKLAPQVEIQIRGATDEEKMIFRTSYFHTYRCYYALQRNGVTIPPGYVPPAETVAQALRYCASGSSLNIRQLATIKQPILHSDLWALCGRQLSDEAFQALAEQLVAKGILAL